MRYGSVCSGISAASVAWGPSLGWKPAWFSEILDFPNRVLAERYPNIPNLGDMTTVHAHPFFKETEIDLLIGGTPCQSFSLGGKRLGLDDPRGNLALEFLRLVQIKRPRWVVWENVSGVLSSYGGGESHSDVAEKPGYDDAQLQDMETPDFAAFLEKLRELRYGYSWRVLDAQFFGIPQQRRRIFVVAHSSGNWRYPFAVLSDPKGFDHELQGSDSKKRSLPILTTTTAGNSNARGVVIFEGDCSRANNQRMDRQGRARACTPFEEERRQGFSGNHTAIDGAKDADRYKAIGNSVAIPVLRWVGEGIQAVETILKGSEHEGGVMEKLKELSRDLDCVRHVINSSLSVPEFLKSQNPNGWSRKKFPACCSDKESMQRLVIITKNKEPKTKNWKPLKQRVIQPPLVTYQNSGVGGPGEGWTFTTSEDGQPARCTTLEDILEPEGSVDFKRYELSPKMFIYTLREAIQKRGAYIYSRRLKREVPKRELWVLLKILAPEDVNEISPGVYRLRKRKGSKGYKEEPAHSARRQKRRKETAFHRTPWLTSSPA